MKVKEPRVREPKAYLTLLERLGRGEILCSDGATGTYLQGHGLEPGGSPEELNFSDPALVRRMAADYFNAGSDLVLTNTFGGSKFILDKYGYGDQVREFNRLGAQHAKAVASPNHFVVGSVGPSGEILESNFGTTPDAEVYDAFVEQITALEEGGAHAVDIETMISSEEACLAVKAAKENTKLVVMSTMMFDRGPRGWFTMMGANPERAMKMLRDAGADIVGANCGNGTDAMVDLARELRIVDQGYMIIHSNAGIPAIRKGQIVYPETPEYMTERFMQMADLGINILGGCCGTTPRHIEALAIALRYRAEGGQ
ncbi:MAG: homocysteine S-methyltransferase family protein, partial [Chloroflexi bacterium]|nr:homocysteine S-methyltransferase family protein [Chloroflexota bacterium]